MVTKRQYEAALKVIAQYKEEQSQKRLNELSLEKINPDTSLYELHERKLISSKLLWILRDQLPYEGSSMRDQMIPSTFKDMSKADLLKIHGVGTSLLNEFVYIMRFAGFEIV